MGEHYFKKFEYAIAKSKIFEIKFGTLLLQTADP
jgi:hypothetical protein